MVQTTFEVFYLGTMSDLDPDESNYTSELASGLVGTSYGSQGDPLYSQITHLTLDDPQADGVIYNNDAGHTGEGVIFQGTQSALDSALEYNITLTYNDGTTAQTIVTVLQDEDGRVFLTPYDAEGAPENAALGVRGITSIKIDSLVTDTSAGVYSNIEADAFVVCFASGTLIDTAKGPVDVAQLAVGDRVLTMDHGIQPIRWIGARRVRARGAVAPIRIGAGALGANLPRRDLRVSPQHRVLLRSRIARRMFGESEVLIAAKKLAGLPGIAMDHTRPFVTYWHLLFDCHEIVFSEGAATESLFAGPEALKALAPAARREVERLFPSIGEILQKPQAARVIARGQACHRLVARHHKNAQVIFQP